MKWRTDKPTAKLIVAYLKWSSESLPTVLYKTHKDGNYFDRHGKEILDSAIEKWADLEEDEGTICPQKQRGRPNKVYEYPVEVPNKDGCLVIYITNSTIRKKLRLKKGERAIISIRKEI